jgi:AcrR family transcriptional regulator
MGRSSEDSVAPVERYPRRAANAARTRTALVGAAHELFIERGYAATTITAIAERAGVSRATVFTSVPGGKPELLKLARDVALVGDTEPVPIRQRSWFREAMEAKDPHELIRLQARNFRRIGERAAALERSLLIGAATDPELASLLAESQQQRAHGTRVIVQHLVDLRVVAARDRDRLADSLYALASPDVFLLLTEQRQWSATRYERWLAGAMAASLLGPSQ